MIIFKLGLFLAFILFAVGVIRIGWRLIKEADEVDVKEKIKDIKLKGDLVDDVEEFLIDGKDLYEKYDSKVIDEFLGKGE